ncbi:MAG TPA: sulfite exporter TauE/SafE family protein [Phycisphaerae bacterium]|nr:sulfite exporter TauE/SafE family protein [Phycisphaerae bacterium]
MDSFGWSMLPVGLGNLATFLALGSLAAMLTSMAKAGFGGSIGLLSVPIMIYACGKDPFLAAGVTLPLLIVCDYVSLYKWWRQWEYRAVWLLLPGALLGVAGGGVTLYLLQRMGMADSRLNQAAKAWLILGIGVIALWFVVLQAVRSLRKRPIAFRPVLWQGTAVGALAGYTSTLSHAAGPVVAMYLLPQRMPPARFVATTVLYFWIGNQVKLVPYFLLGLIRFDTFGASLLLMPAIVFGALLGVTLHKRVGQRGFPWIVYTLLALTGAHLVISAARELW